MPQMKKELFQQIKHARGALALTIIFGVLGAIVMIAQMAFLSTVGLVWWSIGMVLAILYFVLTYRLFWGKVRLTETTGY